MESLVAYPKTTSSDIQLEVEKIGEQLRSPKTTSEQYVQLYAAQQALAWVNDSNVAVSPYKVIMDSKVQPITGIQAN